MRVFLTGATGLLGGELLVALSNLPEIDRIFCLARPRGDTPPEARLRAAFDIHGRAFPAAKVVAIDGDLFDDGLPAELARDARLDGTEIVVHAAANTSFSSRRADAVDRTNVGGLEKILLWAKRLPGLSTFLLVSTAAVCGRDHPHRLVTEALSPDPRARHLVRYTASKQAGELLAREHLTERQLLIARPSIILGDSRGLPPRSPVVLWAVAAINRLRLVPVDAFARLDVVPVDYVAEALARLLFAPRRHDVYHVASSAEHATSARDLSLLLARHFPALPPFRFVDGALADDFRSWVAGRLPEAHALHAHRAYLEFWRAELGSPRRALVLLAALRPYFDFMELDQVFDTGRLRDDTDLVPRAPAHVYLAGQMRALADIDVLGGAKDP